MAHYIDADRLRAEIDRRMTENCELAEKAGGAFGQRAVEDNDILALIDSLLQEQPQVADASKMEPGVDLKNAALHVYESWMGGTMDDVRRDMVTLGTVLNARKEE